MGFQKNMFDKIQQGANINPEDVYAIAHSVKDADFSDEQTVRQLVRQLAQIANKPISQEKEDQIVSSITKNNMPTNMNTLNEFFNK